MDGGAHRYARPRHDSSAQTLGIPDGARRFQSANPHIMSAAVADATLRRLRVVAAAFLEVFAAGLVVVARVLVVVRRLEQQAATPRRA